MSASLKLATAVPFILTAAMGTARAHDLEVDAAATTTTTTTTHTPVNIGLAPYVDVNSHMSNPRNNLSLDGWVGLTTAVDGTAVAGITGIVKEDLNGLQLAGVTALTLGQLDGAQVGGVFNYAGRLRGAQVSVLNIAKDNVEGVQVGGAFNYASQLRGTQVGVINIGGKVTGAQVGVINIAEEVDGVTLGLLNVVLKEGTHTLDLFTTDTAAVNVGTKLGTKHFYSILTVGFQPTENETTWMPGFGLGGHILLRDRWSMDVAALAYLVNTETPWSGREYGYFRFQTTANYELDNGLTMFAGPSLNLWDRDPDGQSLEDVGYLPALSSADGKDGVDIGIGFVAGIQVF